MDCDLFPNGRQPDCKFCIIIIPLLGINWKKEITDEKYQREREEFRERVEKKFSERKNQRQGERENMIGRKGNIIKR